MTYFFHPFNEMKPFDFLLILLCLFTFVNLKLRNCFVDYDVVEIPVDVVETPLKRFDLNHGGQFGDTALHYAVKNNLYELAEKLLEAGVNPSNNE